jgi:putative ABC transport system ATP-binding protein
MREILNYLVFCDKRFFGLIAVYGVIVALLNLALPLSIQVLITSVIYTALIQPVVVLSAVLLFLISFATVLSVLQKLLIEIYKRNSFVRMSSDILLKSIYSNYESFNSHNTSDLSSRYFEIFNIQRNASELIIEGLLIVLSIVVSFILSSFYHPYFLILNLIIAVVIWVTWALFSKKAISRAISRSEAKFAVFAWIDDVFRMNVFFKSGTNKDYAVNKGHKLVNNYIDTRKKYWSITFTQITILSVLYVMVTIALLSIGSILVIQSQLSLGQLVAAEILYTTSLYGVSKLSIYYDKYYELIASADEMEHLLVIENEKLGKITDINQGAIISRRKSSTLLKLDNVMYKDYFAVQHKFDITIAHNTSNLLLSTDQVSKSILIKLITNLIHPDSGTISFNDIQISDFDQHYLRSQITLIDDANMFDCTIREFLMYGVSDLMQNQINNVLELVNLYSVVHSLESKLDTRLIGNGFPLQEQHIILLKIAKAILTESPMIVITEVFDHINKQVQQNILNYLSNETSTTIICFSGNEDNHLNYDNFILLAKESGVFMTDDISELRVLIKRYLT